MRVTRMDWYPWYTGDYRRDARHLSLAEHGAYRLLLDEYMESREPLPDNDRALAAIVGVGVSEWRAVAPNVRPFFRAQDGLLFHKRCDRELRAQELRAKRNSENGKKAAFARWSKPNGLHASAMRRPATLTRTTISSSSEQGAAHEGASEEGRKAQSSETLADVIRRKGWAP